MAINKIKIKLQSYDHRLLDQSSKKIVEIAKVTGASLSGPIPLPTKKEVFTILRSVHVNKPSMEQFERRTHKRLLLITDIKDTTIQHLQKMTIPAGVELRLQKE